ncbi:arginyl-tRNA--protein transferase 1 isoform X1 [Pocillopora verrucosa]|uniref:arginyl-tRNA--protein transferase 1 isoform X1 n=1 Tax=Pocillopora verrucosa TaxID=203993 RepID=UPI0033407E40
MAGYSFVEYFGGDSGHRCGYCGSSDTNYTHGMWAHQMTCLDYQDLIDRGWRRSGQYVYKPMMKKMCCPSYTIKCDALSFKPSKSQKKVLKRMTKFLTVPKSESSSKTDGEDAAGYLSEELDHAHETAFVEPPLGVKPSESVKVGDINCDELGKEDLKATKETKATNGQVHLRASASSGQMVDESTRKTKPCKDKKPAPGLGADPNKPPCRKAKILRQERKMKKLASVSGEQKTESQSSSQNAKVPITKSLEDFMIDRLPNQSPVHDLQVKLVRVNLQCDEFRATYQQTCVLFAKYQIAIHKDHPRECGESQFKRFLVDSPLERTTGPEAPPMGFGSFHQQYFLGDKLIAVGVLDILPRCVSSVYFFYDPDYSFLSLGVYSALREIHFARCLQKSVPTIQSYYMGFYIHSCPKMRYKGNYSPSYLACPETFNWIPMKQCLPKLDLSNYSRLDDSDEESPKATADDVLVFYKRKALPYQMYEAYTEANDRGEVQEYAELVGPEVLPRMLLYRSG